MIGIIVAGVVVLAIAAAWAYRKVCQRRVARTLPIDTNIGIAEGRYVRAGGVDQWIQIRGEDRTNPILLPTPVAVAFTWNMPATWLDVRALAIATPLTLVVTAAGLAKVAPALAATTANVTAFPETGF